MTCGAQALRGCRRRRARDRTRAAPAHHPWPFAVTAVNRRKPTASREVEWADSWRSRRRWPTMAGSLRTVAARQGTGRLWEPADQAL